MKKTFLFGLKIFYKMKQDNFYITTPIYYPSGQPHMGHAYSSILADVFARFNRNDNCKVFFLTGTDEHGLKIQKAAEKNGLEPLIYCDKISKVFRNLTKKLNLSNDDFIRTTENGIDLLNLEIFIYQNIKVGTQYLMKLITILKKSLRKMEKDSQLFLVLRLNGLRKIPFFSSCLLGEKNYYNSMTKMKNLYFLSQEGMRSLIL